MGCTHGRWFGAGYSGGMTVREIKGTKQYISLIESQTPVDLLDYYAMKHDVTVTVSYLKNKPKDAVRANLDAAWGFFGTRTCYGCCAAPGLMCAALCCWNGTFCLQYQCCCSRYDCGVHVPIDDDPQDLDTMLQVMRQVKKPSQTSPSRCCNFFYAHCDDGAELADSTRVEYVIEESKRQTLEINLHKIERK